MIAYCPLTVYSIGISNEMLFVRIGHRCIRSIRSRLWTFAIIYFNFIQFFYLNVLFNLFSFSFLCISRLSTVAIIYFNFIQFFSSFFFHFIFLRLSTVARFELPRKTHRQKDKERGNTQTRTHFQQTNSVVVWAQFRHFGNFGISADPKKC
jgi:hypothetical protein